MSSCTDHHSSASKTQNDVVDRKRFHDQLSTCEPSACNIETQHSDLVEALNLQPHEGYEEMMLTAQEKTPLRNRVMEKDDGSID